METIFIVVVIAFCIMFAIVGFCLIHLRNRIERWMELDLKVAREIQTLFDLEPILVKMNIIKRVMMACFGLATFKNFLIRQGLKLNF